MVTKQTYTTSATWTASQLANIFRSAFIDAGLMTEWYDSFLSGAVENRVLEIIYDGAKTYGKTYYWFQFTITGVFVHLAASWNAGSDIPSGTQYLDYFATTTNSTTNHAQIISLAATTDCSVIRYSSGITSGYCWFLIRNGTTTRTLHIARAAAPVAPWIDLNKVMFHWFGYVNGLSISAGVGGIVFEQFASVIRRSYCGSGLRGATAAGNYGAGSAIPSGADSPLGQYGSPSTHKYIFPGNLNNSFQSLRNPDNDIQAKQSVIAPIGFNNVNPAYSADSLPVMSGFPPTLYINEAIPADFGIVGYFANNTMAPLDTFTVSAGTEVWEILYVSNNGTAVTGCSPMFLARTT